MKLLARLREMRLNEDLNQYQSFEDKSYSVLGLGATNYQDIERIKNTLPVDYMQNKANNSF